jgi:hypothetical protein
MKVICKSISMYGGILCGHGLEEGIKSVKCVIKIASMRKLKLGEETYHIKLIKSN